MSYIHGSALVAAAKKAVGRKAYSSMCQAFCVITAGIGAKGDFDGDRDADAVDGWKKASARGRVVLAEDIKSYADIPAGTLVYWTGGSRGFGHVAITIGGGKVVSTDAPKWGTIGIVDIGFIAKTWKNGLTFVGYIVNDGDGHQMVDVPAPRPTPAATAKPADEPEVWVPHTGWNLGGLDTVGKGAATFSARIDSITAEMAEIGSSVYSLVEIRTEHLAKFKRALDKIDCKVAVYGKGRAVVVRKGMVVGRTGIYKYPETGPANDARYMVYAEVFPTGPKAALVTAGHLEHRDGAAYDKARVTQGRQGIAKALRLAKNWDIDETRVVMYDDENSDGMVLADAYVPAGFHDAFTGAWQADNQGTATLNGWTTKTHAGKRIDKTKLFGRRKARRAHVRKAAAGLSDHLPVTTVVAAL